MECVALPVTTTVIVCAAIVLCASLRLAVLHVAARRVRRPGPHTGVGVPGSAPKPLPSARGPAPPITDAQLEALIRRRQELDFLNWIDEP